MQMGPSSLVDRPCVPVPHVVFVSLQLTTPCTIQCSSQDTLLKLQSCFTLVNHLSHNAPLSLCTRHRSCLGLGFVVTIFPSCISSLVTTASFLHHVTFPFRFCASVSIVSLSHFSMPPPPLPLYFTHSPTYLTGVCTCFFYTTPSLLNKSALSHCIFPPAWHNCPRS